MGIWALGGIGHTGFALGAARRMLDELAEVKAPSLPFRKSYRRVAVDDMPQAEPAAPNDAFNQTIEMSSDVLRGMKPTPLAMS